MEVKDVYVVDIKPTEAIIFEIDFDTCGIDEASDMLYKLKEIYPDNVIVMLPNRCSMKTMTKKQIKNWVDSIDKVLNEMVDYDENNRVEDKTTNEL